jgi:hypothetical protein
MGRSFGLVVWLSVLTRTILIVRGHNTSGLIQDHSLTGDVVKYAEGSGDQLESSPGLSPDRQGSDGDLLESSLGTTDDRYGSEGEFSGDELLFDDLARIVVENFSEFKALELNSPASDHFDEPPKVGLPLSTNDNLLPENYSDPQVKPGVNNEQELGVQTDLTSLKSKKIGSSPEYFGTDPISQNAPIVVEEIPVALPLVDFSLMAPTISPASVTRTPIAAGAGEPISEPSTSATSGAESTGSELRAAEPTISQPSAAESTGADLRAADPTIYQPSVAEQAESDGQSAAEPAVANPIVPETDLPSGIEVPSTWKPNTEEPSSAEQISGNQRNVETKQSKTELETDIVSSAQSGHLVTESEETIPSELKHIQKEAEVSLFQELVHYPTELEVNNSSEPGHILTELEANNSSEPGHIPTEIEANNSSEPGHIPTELEVNNSSEPGHIPTELRADSSSQQGLMPPESEVKVSSESGHIEVGPVVDIAHSPELDLMESKFHTNGGSPTFRLDMPTAENTVSEDKEIALEYRVTRPLMEDVDIRTFLEHHPVDEKRIAEVVKDITQYFEPAWFPEGPLAGSGATGNHVVRHGPTGKETMQNKQILTSYLTCTHLNCSL